MTEQGTMYRSSAIARILITIIIVLLAAPLSFGQEKAEETRPIEIRPPWMMPPKTGMPAGPVKESFTDKDLKVEFTLAPLATGPLIEGEYARISFRLTDASSGAPVPALFPGVWMDAAAPTKAGEKMTCKDRVSIYLKRVMGMGPLLDLNHYYILVMNRDASIAVIDPLVGITGKTSLLASIRLAKPGADWVKGQDHKRLFVTMPLARQVAVIDTDTFKVLRNIDAGEAPTRGIVIGVGFMWFFVQTPLYATIWALLLGYIATYLPYGIRPMSSAFVQIHSHLEESSLVCGAGPLLTMRRIIVPLMIPGIVSGCILMASMFVRELTLSVVLSRPGTEVLAVQILRFSEDGLWGRLSALGIVMIGITTALVVAATLIGNRFKTV